MAVEEKPSHLYAHVSTQSVGSINSLPASPTSPTKPHVWATTASRFLLAKKRWLAGLVVYALIVVAWSRGWYPAGWLRSAFPGSTASIPIRPGEKFAFDAFGDPNIYPSRTAEGKSADQANLSEAAKAGTTSLGPEADAVYHLSDPSPALYLDTLERFVIEHFPTRDADPTNPDSILSTLRSFFPSPADPPVNASIPHAVYMTAATQHDLAQKEPKTRTWLEKNPGWAMRTQDDEQADAWVRRRFTLDSDASAVEDQDTTKSMNQDGVEGKQRGIVATWDRLAEPAVLRSDFWRYLVLAVDGGVYADTDVEPIRPVEKWGEDPEWYGPRPEGYVEPSLIIGIEADVGNRHDWHDWWPRPLQISQWTMASARGHPVMLDTVRRVVEMALEDEEAAKRSVMERTGPGPFTDAVLSYLLVQYRKPWGDLRGLGSNGWRFRASRDAPELLRSSRYGGTLPERWGDTKVLSITGFSPGVGHMGAQDVNDPAAMAVHGFAGSWRNQKGADI